MKREKLSEISEKWLKSLEKGLRISTYSRYSGIIRGCLNPCIGHYSANGFSDKAGRDFALKLSERYSHGTAVLVARVTTRILAFAGSGVAIRIPNAVDCPHSERDVLTEAECRRLKEYVLSHISARNVGVLLTLFLGLRIGEICALQYRFIDLKNGVVSVVQSVQRIPASDGDKRTKVAVISTKTHDSMRKLPIPTFISKILRSLSAEPDAFLLSGEARPIEPRNLERHFARICDAAIGRKVTFHCLRRTFATLSIRHGAEVKTVSRILGHSNVSTTLEFYRAVTIEDERIALSKFERRILKRP